MVFCVLYKSWFLNVTDDCVGFRASYVSCQIIKALIPSQAAGVTIHYCSWEDSLPAWQWEIVLSFHFPVQGGSWHTNSKSKVATMNLPSEIC